MKTILITLLFSFSAVPLSAEGGDQDVQILLKEAHALKIEATKALEQADSAKDKEQLKHLETARDRLLKSREHFSESLGQLQAEWRTYPRFIDRKENPDQYAARTRVEMSMIKAELEVAGNSYMQSRAADPEDKSRGTLLLQASQEYEKSHQKYRTMLAGLIARYWQARCFQEMGDIRKALGIVRELLAHPGRSEQMLSLQDGALHVQLACLNHKTRRDYQLVIDKAGTWIDLASEKRENSASGQGIRWEFANGLESAANQNSSSAEERAKLLSEAVENLKLLSQGNGVYRKSAAKKLEELGAK